MKKLYYRYLTPSAASTYAGNSSFKVWCYYEDGSGVHTVDCGSPSQVPSNAYAAIVATADDTFNVGEALFSADLASDKDPQAPPPPPALQWSVSAYLAQSNVISFLNDQVQRGHFDMKLSTAAAPA